MSEARLPQPEASKNQIEHYPAPQKSSQHDQPIKSSSDEGVAPQSEGSDEPEVGKEVPSERPREYNHTSTPASNWYDFTTSRRNTVQTLNFPPSSTVQGKQQNTATIQVYTTPFAFTPNNEPLYLRYGTESAIRAADAAALLNNTCVGKSYFLNSPYPHEASDVPYHSATRQYEVPSGFPQNDGPYDPARTKARYPPSYNYASHARYAALLDEQRANGMQKLDSRRDHDRRNPAGEGSKQVHESDIQSIPYCQGGKPLHSQVPGSATLSMAELTQSKPHSNGHYENGAVFQRMKRALVDQQGTQRVLEPPVEVHGAKKEGTISGCLDTYNNGNTLQVETVKAATSQDAAVAREAGKNLDATGGAVGETIMVDSRTEAAIAAGMVDFVSRHRCQGQRESSPKMGANEVDPPLIDEKTKGLWSQKRSLSQNDERDDRRLKRSRMVWSPSLHEKFLKAVNKIGVDKAVPTTILNEMMVDGVTRENVASHLQKYRGTLKKEKEDAEKDVLVGVFRENLRSVEGDAVDRMSDEMIIKLAREKKESKGVEKDGASMNSGKTVSK